MIFKTELEKDRTLFKTNFQTNIIAGNDGKSAYEIWLENGNEGTEQDFLNSLKGKDGADGSSADLTPLTEKIDQNTTDIAEINTKIDIEGKLPFANIASACNAIYTNVGAMNGRITALENAGGSSSGLARVIEYASYQDSWYIVFSNGFIAQGGSVDYSSCYGNAYISLLVSFDSGKNTGYDFTHSYYADCVYTGSDASNSYGTTAITDKTEDGFSIVLVGYDSDDGNGKMNWFACGFTDEMRYKKE